MTDEGCGYVNEGEEVPGLASAAGQQGNCSFDDPAVAAEPGFPDLVFDDCVLHDSPSADGSKYSGGKPIGVGGLKWSSQVRKPDISG